MTKILLPVDGSPSAVRATQTLIDTLGWYKEAPSLDVGAVHLPVSRVPNMGSRRAPLGRRGLGHLAGAPPRCRHSR